MLNLKNNLDSSSAEARTTTVMIVDDAVVVRGLMSRWLSEHDDFTVISCARNGRVALEELDKLSPDIVILDLEMPEIGGIEALPLILKKCPTTSVLIASTLTRRNAEISLKCLSLGAVDYITKPETNREVTTSVPFRTELLFKLEALVQARKNTPQARQKAAIQSAPQTRAPDGRAPDARTPASPAVVTRLHQPGAPEHQSGTTGYKLAKPPQAAVMPRCLLIGASTGGPKAVSDVLAGIGKALSRIPVIVVQHMPPIFTSVFAEHLRKHTGQPAREPFEGERLLPGTIYVAPGGRHFGIALKDGNIVARLDDGPLINFCKPAVDVAFLDAAELFGASALAVVLTGMGSDGLGGARALTERGASVIVQDEASSTVWGMPGSIARAGFAQAVLPLGDIASTVSRMIERGGRP